MCTCTTALGASANDNAFHAEMLVNACPTLAVLDFSNVVETGGD